MPYANNDGVRIYYEVTGDGFPLVLQTGGGGDHNMWREAGYVDGLPGFRLILLDHRGHGQSDKPAGFEAHRVERYVADVLAVLDALALPQAAFWGYSAGWRAGYALAAAYPERLTALIASGAIGPTDYSDPARRQEVAELAALVRARGVGGLTTELEADEGMTFPGWFRRQLDETDAEMFALEVLGTDTWDGPWSLLDHIAAPTLMLVGQREDPDGDNPRAAVRMPRARCVTLDGLGHVCAYLRSDLALAHAVPFLREVASKEGK